MYQDKYKLLSSYFMTNKQLRNKKIEQLLDEGIVC
jgi:hypothetical protein